LDGAGLITARAIVTFLQVAIITIGGAVAVLVSNDIRAAIFTLPAGSGLAVVAAAGVVRARGIWTGGLGFDLDRCRRLVRMALPFAVLSGIAAIYRRFDLLVLSIVSTRLETAAYDVSLRVIEAVGYLGSIVSAPALFLLSRRLGERDREGAQRAFDQAARALYLVGLPASAGLVALHQALPRALFGDGYRGAAVPLAILGGQLWIEFIGGLQGSLVVAGDRIREAVRLALGIIALLGALDVVLIMRFQAVGAAIAVAIFQVVNAVAFRAFNRRTTGVTTPLPPPKIALASLVCGVAAWGAGTLGVVHGIVVGIVAYAIVLVGSGGLTRRDRDLLRRIVRSPE
jgi:O-antigen/teichoic acid export membrane protein